MVRARQPPKLPYVEIESDRLSNLPSHVLDTILSFLSIRDAVRTSLLSSFWRYKWANLPHLIFEKDCCTSDDPILSGKFVSIIDRVLLLHDGTIQKFKLSHKDLQAVPDIDRWVLHISRTSVKEFILEIWKGPRYPIPSCLYSTEDLTHLELFNCSLRVPLSFKGFQHLKSLDLQHITLSQEAFERMIVNCPLLERFTLMNFDGFSYLKIHAPNLQFFDVGGVFHDVALEGTFLLNTISIGLYVTVPGESRKRNSTGNLLKFFTHLPRIQRLEVQSYFLKYLALGNVPGRLPVACPYLNYLSIRINFNDLKETKTAFCLLRSSPNLFELEMLARPEEGSIASTLPSSWLDTNDSKGLFDHLRVARVIDISGVRPELDFVKFLLANSPKLEILTVKPAPIDGGMELLKELLLYRRGSIHAEVIYVDA